MARGTEGWKIFLARVLCVCARERETASARECVRQGAREGEAGRQKGREGAKERARCRRDRVGSKRLR